MKFSALCLSAGLAAPSADVEVGSIVHDSRQVQPGCVFVAIKGLHHDGHSHIATALARGAVAVVVQDAQAVRGLEIPICVTGNSAEALGLLWAAWLDWPSRKLTIAGVTGTDGKTTTACLSHYLLAQSGVEVGLVSTVAAIIGQRRIDTGLHVTSPDAPQLHMLLQQMVEAGVTHAVLEVTSHAIAQQRVAGVKFDTAVLTNLTSDHLDYHGSMEQYRATKARLFGWAGQSIVNADDEHAAYFTKAAAGRVYDYSLRGPAFSQAAHIQSAAGVSRFDLVIDGQSISTELRLPGRYNISNALAAASLAYLWGVNISRIADSLPMFAGVPGRFEVYQSAHGATIVVDFAHTTNALQQLLAEAATLKQADGRLWHVFGCAGERDATKRPDMGKVSADAADMVILTAEDPRHEELAAINAAIKTGIARSSHRPKVEEIADRGQAIAMALNGAQPGDVVVVSGKGHEQSQAIGDEELPWSDQEAVRRLIG